MSSNNNDSLPRQPFRRADDAHQVTRIEVSNVHLDAYRVDAVLRRRFGESQYRVEIGEDVWWVEAPDTLTEVNLPFLAV